ncbi:GSCOCG00004742001-RA-CDS [Cotesia congregata]|uniref:gamma-glutamylcyclotransferase n=1 Tax=Cotesia congregata TaxID=51543 RepID=A0A8J2HBH1_COTCN|nr:GSCOCG00004742001-RA-CDS [Cotesia congregata]CAG5092088.1 Similar to GGCT: Gamma-glutamylcyclotransferase (Bos taurus) [Cotesia congregata]
MSNQVLYFAYGSNLLTSRIRINNPSAKLYSVARLENYRLDFIGWSNLWNGAPATIVETPGFHVWGAVWELDVADIKNLDQQEAGYNAFQVDVITHSGATYNCRVYQQIKVPNSYAKLRELPDGRRPSQTYLKIIVKGALDRGLPTEYINLLRKVRHNGFMDAYSDIGQEVSGIYLSYKAPKIR